MTELYEVNLTPQQLEKLRSGDPVFFDSNSKTVASGDASCRTTSTRVKFPGPSLIEGLKMALLVTAFCTPVLIGLAITVGGAMACVWMLTH